MCFIDGGFRFEKYGSNASAIKKELVDIKYKVDTNDLVVIYNEKYKNELREKNDGKRKTHINRVCSAKWR